MINDSLTRIRQTLLLFGVVVTATFGVAQSPADAESRKERKDARTCESFGNSFGTPAYSDCMLNQQERRDLKQRKTLEEMALTSQIAKDGQIMAERARRQRCDRDPDRRECRR